MKLKRLFTFLSLLLALQVFAQYDSLFHNGLYRTYLKNIPSGYSPSVSTPLVFAFHGGLGSANHLQYTSKLTAKSNAEGFLLVYPEGIQEPILGLRTWNGGKCCGYADSTNSLDVGFIRALLDTISKHYNVDTNRIYATGISNGAIMCYRLACEMSDKLAAIAPVAGTLELDTCAALQPVSIVQFHSDFDSAVFVNGGLGTGVSGHVFNSVNYGLAKFDSINNCSIGPDSTYYTVGSSYYYRKRWSTCDCSYENKLYVTGDGGHSWPGGRKGLYAGADTTSKIIYATDTMWSFFMNHPKCRFTQGIEFIQDDEMKIFPNPNSGRFLLSLPKEEKTDLMIHNALGLLVYTKSIDRGSGGFNVDLGKFAKGLYFVTCISGKSKYQAKLIVN